MTSKLQPLPFTPLYSRYEPAEISSRLKTPYACFNAVAGAEACKGPKADLWALRKEREECRRKFAGQALEPQTKSVSTSHEKAKSIYLKETREKIEELSTSLRGVSPKPQLSGASAKGDYTDLLNISKVHDNLQAFLSVTDFHRHSRLNRRTQATKDEGLKANSRSQQRLNYLDIIDYAVALGWIPQMRREDAATLPLRDDILTQVARHFTELKSINLYARGLLRPYLLHQVRPKSIETLLTRCTKMESLDLRGCQSLPYLARTFPPDLRLRLRYLDLSGCGLDNNGLHELTPLPNLTYVNFSYNPHLSDKVLRTFLTGSPRLQTLVMEGQNQLTDETLEAVADTCVGIQAINVKDCSKITGRCISSITRILPHMRTLLVSGTKMTSGESLALIYRNPGLSIF